ARPALEHDRTRTAASAQSVTRFSLATNAKRLRGDHAQTRGLARRALQFAGRRGVEFFGRRERRRPRQRHFEAAQKAFGAPIELRLSTQLRLDACKQALGAEAARLRLPDQRTAGLLPGQRKHLAIRLPA